MLNDMPARLVRPLLVALAFVLAGASAASAADTLSVITSGGFARLLFTLTPKSGVHASVDGGVLTLVFDRKTSITATTIAQNAAGYAGGPRVDAEGRTYRFALAQPVRIHASTSANQVAIDLVPTGFAGTPPDLPPPPPPAPKIMDVNALPIVNVRAGTYQNFTRLVFDWPHDVKYAVMPGAGKIGIRFSELARMDVSSIARFAPPWVKNAAWRIDNRATVVEFDIDQSSGFHDFKSGTKVVLDILAPKADAAAYHPPGMATPSVTPLVAAAAAATPAKPNAVSGAQVAAIAATALQLADANKPAQPAPVPTSAPAATTPPPAAATPAPAAAPTASGEVNRDGAVLTFVGASNRGAAAFVRGLTAWIVLEDSPALDVAKLRSMLRDYPAGVEATTQDGVAVLRVSLKTPARIAARADGSNLRVTIGPNDGNPEAIAFSRNQESAPSLTTVLPGSSRAVTLTDPIAGDQLVVVPTMAGIGMPAAHDYVEFGVMKSAAGLALTPHVDDLTVGLDHSRLTIARPGGLALTAPSAPFGNTPGAIAAAGRGSATFIDFANWAKPGNGSFLLTERELVIAAAKLNSLSANPARLALARFYVANEFGAEALGVINLMQGHDPGLQSDRQLLTLRAAADYMMGRTRDAKNDIAGAQFDSDPNAALWRGLAEAAQEDWQAALNDLNRADPVLKQYTPEWQARARIARAQAAMALGNIAVADGVMLSVGSNISAKAQIEANLIRARLLAAEGHDQEAGAMFNAVERSGDDAAAAQSVYYRTVAALDGGVISEQAAIQSLESLRFRWRGDALEMKTLRKLASLYFAKQEWREGLRTLKVAVEAFPGDERARHAQDDMRAAFADLFIKGKADKLKPVDSLAIFFDFIELTPIGPDGDEMIRKMSDRLIAVDLLEPAEKLLRYQIDKRLDGVARAQVATRLAMVYLMDEKPQQALDTIRSTAIATLPDDMQHQRMLLEARAFAALKQWNYALDLTDVDTAADTQRLRADIYWESGNWAVAGQKAEELLGTRAADAAPLSADDRLMVMRAAVAYSLANDQASLDRLRTAFGPKMTKTPDATAFAVLAQNIDSHGVDFRNKAAQIAAVDTLQNFMRDFRKHYQSIPVSSVAPSAVAPAAAPAAPTASAAPTATN
ncbi:MAG: hypothetical protein ISS15_11455 [Alphaproteobacteria bacterium]|nr:hypothetical protein [Alphaproteobacteria bacterium]MBL7098268.1 hypothetical protein [Alphaproteobacteria bacterium]